jgi:hypothetical protein
LGQPSYDFFPEKEARMLVCDGFLRDEQLLGQLRNKHLWQNFPAFSWWDGWWRSPPKNFLEQTIQKIWQGQVDETEIAGFEYWFNALDGKGLNWHRDCDEALRHREGRYVCPVIGHVYYVIVEDVVGGFMELSDRTSLHEVETSELQRIQPVENRLVIFNPSYWHRVSRLAKGKRLAFQTNLWPEKPSTFALGNQVDKTFQPIA